MASSKEVQKTLQSNTKNSNDVESRLNTAIEMMETYLDLDMKQKQEQKKVLSEIIQQQFQKEFEEYRRKSEENIQQLKTIFQTQVDEIRTIFSTLQSGSINSHKEILNREDQRITSKVTPATTIDNLERIKRQTNGTYENWELITIQMSYLVPVSEFKNMVMKLEKLDVTVKTHKAKGIALIDQLSKMYQNVSVSKNRRFPLNGDYCGGKWLTALHTSLNNIEDDCFKVNYNQSKSNILTKFQSVENDEGWNEAYTYAINKYTRMKDVKSTQSRLDAYLWLMSVVVKIDITNCTCQINVFNTTTFEKKHGLKWKDCDIK